MMFKSVLALSLSLLMAASCASVSAGERHVIPLDLSGPRPTVQVSIGGRTPEPWIFDTGSEGSHIDIERARAWNLPERQPILIGSPAGGEPVQGFVTHAPDVVVGGLRLNSLELTAAPPLAPVAGILSPSMFAGRLVTVDFARSELRIEDRNDAPNGAGTPYETMEGGHALPALDIEAGGRTFRALIDTGAPASFAFPYAMASSLPLASAPVRVGMVRFIDGEHALYRATLTGAVRVGSLTVTNPEVDLIDGLPFMTVGMRLLRGMSITLDPQAKLAWAAPSGLQTAQTQH